jgi:hypothetical protein
MTSVDVVDPGAPGARNRAWRASDAEWVCFLGEDVVTQNGWCEQLVRDLADLPPRVAGSHGRIEDGRARWRTADMAYRRSALQLLGGFDERFHGAGHADVDLALRAKRHGLQLVHGRRRVASRRRDGRPGCLRALARRAGGVVDRDGRARVGADRHRAA